ncbi:hypothetical protein K437DRAFT_221668 [Tilletiaria anomala UBC 951]|uniref:60S ribosomal protein L6 n=1 Tax=Tilletiaria anomala (strain ATCC 24038 / CBS 436.72 / UBC 951) TaxID=1037660 RepID=A0A066WJV2_TILAU|nr:uncharacterized protein K437DRAFT_221668 [Tilletiaria anomala UBC 951]KDN51294.1 hypothetical protein K437DRAFT_221668 [Tilletiaria anomala UBC 951]
MVQKKISSTPKVGRVNRSIAYSQKQKYKHVASRKAQPTAEAPAAENKTKQLPKGGSRTIPARKALRFYPAEDVKQPKISRKTNKKAGLRKSITPGTVLILLAGRFAGRRVVFLKQLASGLLLVTGPFKINGVPIRRVNAAYVIATSTKIDISGVKVDEKLDDAYFAREKAAKSKPEQSFFADPANKAAHPEAKVADQKALDKEVIAAVKKAGPTHLKYLAATFSLSTGDRPHAMVF